MTRLSSRFFRMFRGFLFAGAFLAPLRVGEFDKVSPISCGEMFS